MATEILYATGSPVSTGNCPNPSNAHGAVNQIWAGPTVTNSDWTHRWSMGDPVNPLTTNTQSINIQARKNGTGGNDPTLTVNLYDNGTLVRQLGSFTITATGNPGQTVNVTFAGNEVSSGANVEIELVSSHGGGGPSGRYEVQVDAMTWSADTAAVIPSYDVTSSWGFSTSVSGASSHTEPASLSWGFGSSSNVDTSRESDASLSWGFSTTTTSGPSVSKDVSVSWGFSTNTTEQKVGQSDVTYSFPTTTTIEYDHVGDSDISTSFGFSSSVTEDRDANYDPALSFGFSSVVTSEKTSDYDVSLSWGFSDSLTYEHIGEVDLSSSWGYTSDVQGSGLAVPGAVTDLVAVTGGAPGEVTLTWSEPAA